MSSRSTAIKAFSVAALIEAATLPVMFLTMGHAGPEGRFGTVGWLCVAVNAPGIVIARALLPSNTVSPLPLAGVIFVTQTLLLGSIIFGALRLKKRWFTTPR
jgi:hypothetical protein